MLRWGELYIFAAKWQADESFSHSSIDDAGSGCLGSDGSTRHRSYSFDAENARDGAADVLFHDRDFAAVYFIVSTQDNKVCADDGYVDTSLQTTCCVRPLERICARRDG